MGKDRGIHLHTFPRFFIGFDLSFVLFGPFSSFFPSELGENNEVVSQSSPIRSLVDSRSLTYWVGV